MITKWKLFNFKSVRKETELEFGPLTILAGPNSSGKSTWIQSILLISQTLAHKISSRSVVLNGALARLGQFDDLRSFDSDADQILIGWECVPLVERQVVSQRMRLRGGPMVYGPGIGPIKSIGCDVSFDAKESGPERQLAQLQPRLFSFSMSSVFIDEDETETTAAMSMRQTTSPHKAAEDISEGVDPRTLQFDVALDSGSLKEVMRRYASATPVGCTQYHFLPESLIVRYSITDQEAREIAEAIGGRLLFYPRSRYRQRERIPIVPRSVLDLLKRALGESSEPIDRLIAQRSLFQEEEGVPLNDLVAALRRVPRVAVRRALEEEHLERAIRKTVRETKGERHAVTETRFPWTVIEPAQYLQHFFSHRIKYLGPLRDEPRSLYPLVPSADPADIGLRGEHTAAVLDSHRDTRVRFVPPGSLGSSSLRKAVRTRTLKAAVTEWLEYLGVAESVETEDRGKHGHEMKVTTSGTVIPQDLTHVGVGVSQVLPILVMGLLAERDTTLVIEQPELHLHPSVQTRLADFFLTMALLDKQCIVETHSEYLVNRVRLRIASEEGEGLAGLLKLYFAEKRGQDSCFREVVVNEYGAIMDWPEGFFDQSQIEAENILKASTRKRKARRKERGNAQRDD